MLLFEKIIWPKSAIEGAIWDLYAKKKQIPLSEAIGGKKKQIEVGISIGIQKSTDELLSLIDRYATEGYRRMKVKIKPGWDVNVIAAIRKRFPDIPLMADANSAYSLADLDLLKELDQYGLMMIEQPLASDDIIDHATLQSQIKTPFAWTKAFIPLKTPEKPSKLGAAKLLI